MPAADLVAQEIQAAGLSLPPEHQSKLELYVRELEHWNRIVNLTSLRDAALVRRLVVEPAWIGHKLQMSGKLADIGSGNGSPAIPIYVTCSFTRAHLVESRSRRAAFLRHVAQKLAPGRIVVHRARLEEMEGVEPVDWITLQAVRPAENLLVALRRLLRPTTRVVWITSGQRAPVPGAFHLSVPNSNTEAWSFQLDQF